MWTLSGDRSSCWSSDSVAERPVSRRDGEDRGVVPSVRAVSPVAWLFGVMGLALALVLVFAFVSALVSGFRELPAPDSGTDRR